MRVSEHGTHSGGLLQAFFSSILQQRRQQQLEQQAEIYDLVERERSLQGFKMPMFVVNTNVSKDAVPESLTGELTQQLAKATGKPAQVSSGD